jgi:hypothetical protein
MGAQDDAHAARTEPTFDHVAAHALAERDGGRKAPVTLARAGVVFAGQEPTAIGALQKMTPGQLFLIWVKPPFDEFEQAIEIGAAHGEGWWFWGFAKARL